MRESGAVFRCHMRMSYVSSRVSQVRADAEKLSRMLDENCPAATVNIPFIISALLEAESRLEDTLEELEAF